MNPADVWEMLTALFATMAAVTALVVCEVCVVGCPVWKLAFLKPLFVLITISGYSRMFSMWLDSSFFT